MRKGHNGFLVGICIFVYQALKIAGSKDKTNQRYHLIATLSPGKLSSQFLIKKGWRCQLGKRVTHAIV